MTELAKRIEALSPPDRLRLAAELLEERQPALAHAIVARVADDLGQVLGKATAGGEGCTPWEARWCAAHGDCTCPSYGDHGHWLPSDDCPLHGGDSGHGDIVDPVYQDPEETA